MAYLILARKYRPQKFADLTGQATTAKILQAALMQKKIAPAYLFSGPRGTGKTTTARIFAKAMNCKKSLELRDLSSETKKLSTPHSQLTTLASEPCNACVSCQEISLGSSLDVLEMDAASHTQVENMREVVIDTVAFAPVRDFYKIFIIDEVHMLSNHSFNALLKTLEEPPPHVVFILCTTELHRIPATISSRCQRFRFLPLTAKEIFSSLKQVAEKEKISLSAEALALLVKSSAGSMRDALSFLDQIISDFPAQLSAAAAASAEDSPRHPLATDLKKVEETLGMVGAELLVEFIQRAAEKNARGVLECIGKISKEGYDLTYFLKELRESFRQMLIEKCGYKDEDSFSPLRLNLPTAQFSLHQLLRNSQLLIKCAEQMRWNDSPRSVLECYAVWLCQDAISANELLERFKKNESPDPQSSPDDSNGAVPTLATRNPISDTEGKSSFPESGNESPPERSADFKQIWRAILNQVQESKPSLLRGLEMASVQWGGDKIELTFSKSFWLENVKRNLNFLESLLGKLLNKSVPMILKLAEKEPAHARAELLNSALPESVEKRAEDKTPSEESEPLAAMTQREELVADSSNIQNSDADEIFEVVDEDGAANQEEQTEQIEDEGLKIFLHSFSGKLFKMPPQFS